MQCVRKYDKLIQDMALKFTITAAAFIPEKIFDTEDNISCI
jgi:hypothetical protein